MLANQKGQTIYHLRYEIFTCLIFSWVLVISINPSLSIYCFFITCLPMVSALFTHFSSTIYKITILKAKGILGWTIKAEASGENANTDWCKFPAAPICLFCMSCMILYLCSLYLAGCEKLPLWWGSCSFSMWHYNRKAIDTSWWPYPWGPKGKMIFLFLFERELKMPFYSDNYWYSL